MNIPQNNYDIFIKCENAQSIDTKPLMNAIIKAENLRNTKEYKKVNKDLIEFLENSINDANALLKDKNVSQNKLNNAIKFINDSIENIINL